jgi:hypothetical protein
MKYILFSIFILLLTIVISQRNPSKESSETIKTYESSIDNETNTIEYQSLAPKDEFEIRKYPELTVATTELSIRQSAH